MGFNDDLVFGVDGGDAGESLNHALAGRHLGAVGIGAVAFADGALAALTILGMIGQPLTQCGGFLLQAFSALALFLGEVGFCGQRVVLAVAFEHLLGGGFEFVGLMREVGTGAAFGFGRIAGQLDAVDGEHFLPDQALPVAEVEHLREEFGDFLIEAGDEGGEGREVWRRVTGERNEGDVFPAQAFDPPAADDALRVGAENEFEQGARRIGRGTVQVVTVTGIETGKIEFVIEQVMHGMLETAGQQLFLQIDGEKTRAGVDDLVTGHDVTAKWNIAWTLVIPVGSPQNAGMMDIFLQRR